MKLNRTVLLGLVVAGLTAQMTFAAPAAKKPAAKPAAGGATAAAIAKGMGDDAPPDKVLSGKISIPTDAADIAAGKALFAKNCASCHGPNGEGNGPAGMMLDPKPRNYHTDKFKYGSDDAHIATTVWLGAKHWKTAPATSGMAGFKGTKVTKEQVLQILSFVKHDFIGKK
ncbi:MAG TPA: cytochrome c [Candidatus Xenobia bacterium]